MNELTVKLTNITKSFGNKDLFEIEELSAYVGDKIAIVGPNGTGKSTLLKIINDSLAPDNGEVRRETDFNYFAQIDDVAESISEEIEFKLLSHFNVPDNIGLSGGEETKLRLTETLSNYKLGLLLDEPTNFIDLKTIEALEAFINAYQGMVIVTSHDHEFITRVSDEVFKIKDQKLIRKDQTE